MKKFKIIIYVFSLIFFFSNFTFPQNDFPNWAKGVVWYQIFPERFANGDTLNDPTADKVFANQHKIPKGWHVTKWTSNWFARSNWEKNIDGSFHRFILDRRYGGDLQGIIDHLDYLKNLGINAIYLNPIFDAVSLHKYDGSTYHHVDINFGPNPEGDKKLIESENPDDPKTWVWTSADSLFLKLIQEVHKRGMHIIIDGVFNHTGRQFWAFKDIVKNQQNSKYKDWYIIYSFDDSTTKKDEFDYKGWWGGKNLPEFNRTDNDLAPGPKQYIFYATQRWMDPNNDGDPSDGIDGWRLDVAKDVPIGFWKDWRKLVKSINPSAIIIGEIWGLSPDYVSGNGPFDALMNYNFAFSVMQYFIDKKDQISTTDFINKLKEIDETYPSENLYLLMNLVDSHDTERLSSMINNPDRKYDRDANARNPNYNPGKPDKEVYERQKMIAAFQMTYLGSPMIYYGDEVGMWGADDPHDRKPMIWDNLKYDNEKITAASGFKKGLGTYKVEQNKDLLNFYKKIISIHDENPVLQKGDLKFVYSNNNKKTFAFERNLDNEKILALFNIGNESDSLEITLGKYKYPYEELLTHETGTIQGSADFPGKMEINIPSNSFLIYKFTTVK